MHHRFFNAVTPSLHHLLLQALVHTLSSSHLFLFAASLPVLQCDVTVRELMLRILRVLHSSLLTHISSTTESRS